MMGPSSVLAATPPATVPSSSSSAVLSAGGPGVATSTSVLKLLTGSPSYVLDHEYGQTPVNQIMRGTAASRLVPPARTEVSPAIEVLS